MITESQTKPNEVPLNSPRRRKRNINANSKIRDDNSTSLFGGNGTEIALLLKDVRPVSDRWSPDNEDDALPSTTMQKLAALQVSTAMSCATCGTIFDSRHVQTQHFKTDWHRFNIKQRLKGANSVSEMNFTDMADNISSLSGTDFTESDSNDTTDNNEGKKLKLPRLPVLAEDSESSSDDEDGGVGGVLMASRQCQLYLLTPSGQVLSLYRAVLFGKKEHPENVAHILQQIEQAPSNNLWIVMMMGGGHFAAAVFENGVAVVHKTFHRYVVRAKSGTSQSQYDKQGGHAQSAGAQIRRHNEMALTQDIEELLESWKAYIDKCHRIFLRIGTHNFPYIFNKKAKVSLDKKDQRIRMIPFPTKRATFSEVKRVFTELSSIKLLDAAQRPTVIDRKKKVLASKRGPSLDRKKRQGDPADELDDEIDYLRTEEDIELTCHEDTVDTAEILKEDIELICYEDTVDTAEILKDHGHFIPSKAEILEQETLEKKPMSKNGRKSHDLKSQKQEQERLLPFQSEFYTACTLGDMEQLEELVANHAEEIKHGADNFSSVISLPLNRQGHTLLHIACQHAHSHLIPYLLGIGCDPSKEDEKHTVPYLFTPNKAVRNEFRIFMGSYPDKFDYSKAHVPGPLTKEMATEKGAKESERRKALNMKKKEKLKIKKAQSAIQRAEEEEERRFIGLSDREKRAMAAEKRLLAASGASGSAQMVLNRCYFCAKDITGKVPFEYSSNTFCSPSCLKSHRLAQKKS